MVSLKRPMLLTECTKQSKTVFINFATVWEFFECRFIVFGRQHVAELLLAFGKIIVRVNCHTFIRIGLGKLRVEVEFVLYS
jgi:hypothetical protein